MKAIIINENGGTEKLFYREDFPVPEIKPNEVLVNVKATSINRAELVVRQGYPGLILNFPHILGGDITGIIEKTGVGVKGFEEGDRVVCWPIYACGECEWCRKGRCGLCFNSKYFGMHIHGSYAEYVAVPELSLIKLPDKVPYEAAACLPVAGLTAYHALSRVGNLKKDETFFIWGGTSGLGLIAIQIAKYLGAEVFATAGNEKKIEYLKFLGIEHVFNHNLELNIADEVLKLTANRGIDMVLDYVGPATYEQSFRMVKKGGRILWCGIITGRETTISIHQTYLRHISLLGLHLGEKSELEELINFVEQGKVKPHIHTVLDLKEAAEGHQMVADRNVIGKVVLVP